MWGKGGKAGGGFGGKGGKGGYDESHLERGWIWMYDGRLEQGARVLKGDVERVAG